MSIKTMKQRIAVLAVSALTVGLVTVATVPSANANIAHGTNSTTLVDGNLLVSGSICAATSAAAGTPRNYADSATDTSPFETTAGGKVIVVPLGGDLLVEGDAADVIAITGGLTIRSLTTSGTSTVGFSTAGVREVTMPATDAQFNVTASALGTATLVAGTATNTTPTTANTITVSVVAACATTTYSASKSSVSTTNDGTTAAIATANVDVAVVAQAGDNLYIMVDGDNAYDANLVNQSYYASATNGALLSWGGTFGTAPAKGSASIATLSADADGAAVLRVAPASEAAGGTTVVTITADGVAVATKTLTFLGEATKINIVANASGTVGTIGTSSTGYILFTLTDAAGRQVPGDISMDSTTASARTTTLTEGKDATIVAATPGAPLAAVGSTTYGAEAFDCTSSGGSGSTTVTLKHTQAITGASISTTAVLKCAGGVDTYTVSTDKASYAIGEVAKITITAKDSTGAAVSDATAVGTGVEVSGGGGTMVKAAAATDLFVNGVKTYQVQLTTAGSFNAVVNIAGTTTTSATAAYKVTGGDATNAEVLKSIVALIASINKQIAALQKLILKR